MKALFLVLLSMAFLPETTMAKKREVAQRLPSEVKHVKVMPRKSLALAKKTTRAQ